MSPPQGYIAIPSSPTSSLSSGSPLMEEKTASRFGWIYAPSQPAVQLPLTTADASLEINHKQRKHRCFRRLFLAVFAIVLLGFSFGNRFRAFSGCGGYLRTNDFPGSMAESVDVQEKFVTSHLNIYRTSGSISGEYTLQPKKGDSTIIGIEDVDELAPKGYSTSAHVWTKSGSVDVGITVIEADDDDDDDDEDDDSFLDALKKKKKKGKKTGTLLTIGSQSGSVRARLHSRPASSPVHASLHSKSGSIHLSLPEAFSGPFRIHTRSGSFNLNGSLKDRLVIEHDIDGMRSGWIYANTDFQRERRDAATEEEHKESLNIGAESGSVTLGDA